MSRDGPSTVLEPGDVVGDYVVEGVLGSGGAGAVYQVRAVDGAGYRALKLVHSTHPELVTRLQREAGLQASLHHRHILEVYGTIDVGGYPGVLMELVTGPSLAEWIDAERPSLAEAMVVFRGIALGVGAAHSHGLIHRDLKPGNVLLRVENDVVVPVVADFGLAKSLLEDKTLTAKGARMGTPAFMSPEQFQDTASVDRRTDLWALGVLLYQLTTGRLPFEGRDLIDLMQQIGLGEYADPRDHVPDLPERLVESIDGCLTVDQRQRFADVPQLLAFLDESPETALFAWNQTLAPVAPEAHSRETVELNLAVLDRVPQRPLAVRPDVPVSPARPAAPAPAPPRGGGAARAGAMFVGLGVVGGGIGLLAGLALLGLFLMTR